MDLGQYDVWVSVRKSGLQRAVLQVQDSVMGPSCRGSLLCSQVHHGSRTTTALCFKANCSQLIGIRLRNLTLALMYMYRIQGVLNTGPSR